MSVIVERGSNCGLRQQVSNTLRPQKPSESYSLFANCLTEIPWLLIFDNVDTTKEGSIDEFWPSGDRGSILVTARDESSLGQFTGTVHHLQNLSEDEGIKLLMQLSKK